MKVMIDRPTMLSINSVSIGASKDDVAPVITRVAITRDGDTLRAMATDRYIVVSGQYNEVVFDGWDDGEMLLVDPKVLKTATDSLKAAGSHTSHQISIAKNEAGGALIEVNGSMFQCEPMEKAFPPVAKLLKFDREPNGSPVVALRPDFVAKLAKVLPPEVKPDRSRAWAFEFRTGETNKPERVYANYSNGKSYQMEALIQPQLMVK